MYGFGQLIDSVSVSDIMLNVMSTIQKNTHSILLYEQMQYELMKVNVKNNIENK